MTPPALSLGSWLAGLSDEQLVRLLELRPDLAQPTPGSIAALAARANSRQSVKVATDDLDFGRLAVLDALLMLKADTAAVPVAGVRGVIGDELGDGELAAAIDTLRERALIWGDDEIRVPAEVAAALPWYPGQAVTEDGGRSAAELSAAIDALDAPAHDLLDRLVSGSPVGRTRDAAPGTPADRPVQQLLAAGLLRVIGDDTVILPRAVGQVLRGEEPGPAGLLPPDPVVTTTTAKDTDSSAAGAAMEL
ncbi:MAG: DNA-binding protein, partial [Mycobacterium sp.]|nr:DNA-binding protein [Mycobacterium sp.]